MTRGSGDPVRPGPVLQAQLCVDANAAGERLLCAASRRWFEDGAPALGGELWQRLRQRPTPLGHAASRWQGAPGEVWAECAVEYGYDHEWGCYTDDAWQALLAGAEGPSVLNAFTLYELADLGSGRLHPGFPRLSLSARYIDRRSYGYWGFKAQISTDLAVGSPQRERRLLAQVRAIAEMCPPTYGEISFDNASHIDFATSLEHNLGLYPWQTVRRSARTLRGYSWLTIIGKTIGNRLGGLDALRASGAFAQVDRLAGGGYWLLATDHFADYGLEQATRVQQVLAPALPAGQPRPDIDGELPHLLALVDARPQARRRPPDREEIFKNRIDPRYASGHRTVVALRMATLHSRYPHALIWGTYDDEGPHLICWGAEPGQVWVWQVMPEDDPYAGMDIAWAVGQGLAEVAADPLSDGLQVKLGPTFEHLGLASLEAAADTILSDELVTVFDGQPGLQLYYCDDTADDADDAAAAMSAPLASTLIDIAYKLRSSVSAARAALPKQM